MDHSSEEIMNFVKKLWDIVDNPCTNDIVCWSSTGKSFHIKNQIEFLVKLLPKYFKHRNMGSFVRQLNMYDFHKAPPCSNAENTLEFYNSKFDRFRPDLLKMIKRKYQPHKMYKTQVERNLSKEVIDLRAQLTVIENDLKVEQKKNVAMTKHLGSMQTSYNTQACIIKRLVDFLCSYCKNIKNESGKFTQILEFPPDIRYANSKQEIVPNYILIGVNADSESLPSITKGPENSPPNNSDEQIVAPNTGANGLESLEFSNFLDEFLNEPSLDNFN